MTGESDAGTVITERRGPVLVVRLLRESKRNAINERVAKGIEDALDSLESDSELRVGVITGTASIFCAGSDLHESERTRMPHGGEYGIIRRRRTKPLIAAVEGGALGGGLEIAFACDLVVASETAYFGLPEARRGTLAASGALFRAVQALPTNVARELLLTGRTLDVDRAVRLGFVNEATPAGAAVDRACAMAAEICRAAPNSVLETLQVLREVHQSYEDRGWLYTGESLKRVRASADMREGVAAFFEKREPRWVTE
jgi:enoyl-CoA hydratase/carnithine racemase